MVISKTRVKECFSRAVFSYDQYAYIQKQSSYELAKLTSKHNINPMTILDIGAGTGLTSVEMMKKYPTALYTLCDLSEEMLTEARKKEINVRECICADAEYYTFNKYDLVISNLAMQWFNDFETFISRIFQYTDVFVFSTLLNSSFQEYKQVFKKYNIIPPTPEYMSGDQIEGLLRKYGEIKQILEKTYIKESESMLSAAKYFKNLGANASVYEYQGNFLSLLRSFQDRITLNYDVIFVVFKKQR